MRFRQHERSARQSTLRLLGLFALVVAGLLVAVNAVLALIYLVSFPFLRGWPAAERPRSPAAVSSANSNAASPTSCRR